MNFTNILDYIDNFNYTFINNYLDDIIKTTVNNFFPILQESDKIYLYKFTKFCIEIISNKYFFKPELEYYSKWSQNSERDIKGVILLLLPFIDDKNNGEYLKEIIDLNQLFFSKEPYAKEINKYVKQKLETTSREEALPIYFKYGNMGISLLDEDNDNILDLYPNDIKLSNHILQHNLLALLNTLEIMNGKTFINWVNIIPVNDYTTSEIYLASKKYMDYLITHNYNTLQMSSIDKDNNGLWIGEYYNIIRNRFYNDAKSIKWLLFPYSSSNINIYLIQGLNKLFDINWTFNSNPYVMDIPEINSGFILSKFRKLFHNFSTNVFFYNKYIDSQIITFFLVNLVSNSKISIVNKKFMISIKPDEDLDDEDKVKPEPNKIDEITYSDIIDCLQDIIKQCSNFENEKLINEWLCNTIKEFKQSAYSKYLFDFNNNQLLDEFNIKNTKLNLKNIYNISKSLSHNNQKDWLILNKNWQALEINTRQTFLQKVNNNINIKKWISLRSNFTRQYEIFDNNNYDATITNLVDDFKNIYMDLIFEELSWSGLLSQFVLNNDITDKARLPPKTKDMQNERKSRLKSVYGKNKENWGKAHYFLTNQPYNKIPTVRLKRSAVINQNDKYETLDYWDIMIKDHGWMHFYATDWLCQIGFFKHFIYHQIMYVTGATGQGKSTQVPKLLMYASKSIDYKFGTNVVCTQPRITPTTDNAKRIAEEMGFPLVQQSNIHQTNIILKNYWLQYKYQGYAHVSPNTNIPSLKIMTDGSLLEELKANPTMFKPNPVNKSELTNSNIYDIIIVDEAHEHNTNMDIIITLSKQTCFYNNTVRLIIVSATMDDDEPIYRRYFKWSNDNLLFPIKAQYNPFIKEQDKEILYVDTKYLDRRFHISPPGETTQYKVTEEYLPSNPNALTHKENAVIAQQWAYDKIIEICNTTLTGEILMFANGMGEITKALKYLNAKLPPDVIALPFYSELHELYRNLVTNIDTKKSDIFVKKSDVHLLWGDTYYEDKSVPRNLYKRAIIIATNVAEASITLNSLEYVVDNGYAKVNTFDRNTNKSELIVDEISEASRLQRKGRVGRVRDGTVYYMYKKDKKKFIKPKYKITQEDVSNTISSLCVQTRVLELIIDNIMNIFNGLDPELFKSNKLYTIYKSNYSVDNKDKYIKDFLDKDTSAKGKILFPYISTYNGQLFQNLFDINKDFYLIHPFESYIKSNVFNKIFEYNRVINNPQLSELDKKKIREVNYVPSEELYYLMNNLLKNKIIVADIKLYNTVEDYSRASNDLYYKTELGLLREKYDRIYGVGFELSLVGVYSKIIGVHNETSQIMIFLQTIGNNLDIIKKYSCHKSKSDLIVIYDICKKIKNKFSDLDIFKWLDGTYIENLYNYAKDILSKYSKSAESKRDYDIDIHNKLTEEYENKTDELKKLNIILNQNIKKLSKPIDKSSIKRWCEENYLDVDIVINYLNNLLTFTMKTITNDLKELDIACNIIGKKWQIFDDINDKIIYSWFAGMQTNIMFYDNNKYSTYIGLFKYNCNNVSYDPEFKTPLTLINITEPIFWYYQYAADPSTKIIKTQIYSMLNPKYVGKINQLFVAQFKNFKTNSKSIEAYINYVSNNTTDNDLLTWSGKDTNNKEIAPIMNRWHKNLIGKINI